MGSNDNLYDDGGTKPIKKRILTIEEHEKILASERLVAFNLGYSNGYNDGAISQHHSTMTDKKGKRRLVCFDHCCDLDNLEVV
jgi:hypothetical protein